MPPAPSEYLRFKSDFVETDARLRIDGHVARLDLEGQLGLGIDALGPFFPAGIHDRDIAGFTALGGRRRHNQLSVGT